MITITALQYKEVSRRPGVYADIVERNSSQIVKLLGTVTNEKTIPNDTKEGCPVLMSRTHEGEKLVIHLGDWLVKISGHKPYTSQFKVVKDQDFSAIFKL